MIQPQRLAKTFSTLVSIDSVSRKEGQIAAFLQKKMEELGAVVATDNAAQAVGGETGNLIARFAGTVDAPPLMLNAHMDTVEPGRGIRPIFENGVFKTDGTTILGSDDKSAVAVLLEVLAVLKENNMPRGPLEVVFTVCEELGLLGAKNLDFSLITARSGFCLDSMDTDGIVVRAPSANRLEFTVHGRDAHAGAAPELGVNAIWVASSAIGRLDLGRVDEETTCNLGLISGGVATNIVPSLVTVKGEARSHNDSKLAAVTDKIVAAFEDAAAEVRAGQRITDGLPRVEARVQSDFTRIDIPPDHPVVRTAFAAAGRLSRILQTKVSGGGSDANVFFGRGIMTGVLGTGMTDVHTVRETVALNDMVRCAELVLEIILCHAGQGKP